MMKHGIIVLNVVKTIKTYHGDYHQCCKIMTFDEYTKRRTELWKEKYEQKSSEKEGEDV